MLMGGAMSNKQNNALSVPPAATATGSSPNRPSPAKRVSINPNPVTIPSSEPLPAAAATTTTAGEVRGTIPVADSIDPSKVNNVTVSVASEHSYADANKKTDSSSDSSSSTSSSSSSSDDDDDIEEQADQTLQSITTPPAAQTTVPRGRGRPRKNTPSRVAPAPAASSPAKRPLENNDEEKEDNRKKRRGRGCGACPGCVRSDCGTCQYCKDKPKFGGPGKKKQRCSFRVCSNFVSPAGVIRSKACVNKPNVPIAPKTPQQQTRSATQAVVAASIRAKIAADTTTATSQQPVKEIDSAAVTPSAPPPPPPAAPSPLKKQGTTAASKQTATTPGSKQTPGKQAAVGSSKTGRGVAVSPAMLLAAAAVTQGNKSSQVERCVSMCVLTSLCLLENFRKSQPATETTSSPAAKMMKCCQCGRERKLTISRTNKFCTQRCLKLWEERHPGKNPDTAIPISSSLSSELFLPPPDGPGKQTPRAIKNLHIDMAYPGTVLQQHIPLAPISPPPSDDPPTTHPSSAAPITTVSTPRPITPRLSAGTGSVPRPTATSRPPVTTVTASIIRTPPSAAAVSSVSAATQVPPVRPALSNGIKRSTQLSSVTPPTKKTKKTHELPVDILKWSVRDVGHYFESTVDCRDFSSLLEEQEVDGAALLLITSDTLVKCLSIKLGPALKIMMHVERLKAQQQALS